MDNVLGTGRPMRDPNFRVVHCCDEIISTNIPKNNATALELQDLSEVGIRIACTLNNVDLNR